MIVVTVEEAFQHCSKALVRADLWKASKGGRPEGVPTLGDFAAARNSEIDGGVFDVEYAERFVTELY